MVAGTGTLLNAVAVLGGGAVGLAAGERIPERVRRLVMDVLGLFTCVLGVRTTLLPQFPGQPSPDLAIVLIALLVGGVAGSMLGIDATISRCGAWMQSRLSRAHAAGGTKDAGSDRIAQGFVTTSLLFCVGPLTLLGAFNDGSRGDILLLGVKSGLDGFAALALAASLGWGVLLSAGTVLIVQGALTAIAYTTRGGFDAYLVTQALGAGGVMLVGIGLGLLDLRRILVADLLPALALAPLVAALSRHLGWPL